MTIPQITAALQEQESHKGENGAEIPAVGQRQLLLWAAADYWQRGWRPFPLRIEFDEDGKKVPAFPKGFTWTALRDRAFTWEETVGLFAGIEGANAVGIVLEPGHIVVETDTREAAEVMAGCVLPDGPRARSQAGGLHLHFRAGEELTEKGAKPGGGLEFLCRQVVFMPPSLGRYAWEALPDGDPPDLPPTLAAILRLALNGGKLERGATAPEKATPRTERPTAAQVGEGQWAEWEALVGPMKADGPTRRKGICPLHFETRASFVVYRGKRLGRLQGECFGGGCEWKGSLRQLRQALRKGDSTLYRVALGAVASLGDEIDAQTRRALLVLVGEFQARGLDPREGLGWSYREIAAATGCEPLLFPEDGPRDHNGKAVGVLAYRGKGVRRLFARLAAIGLEVKVGRPRMAGRQGRRSELTLPPSWFPGIATHPTADSPARLHLPSSDVGNLPSKQAEGQTEVKGGHGRPDVTPSAGAGVTGDPRALEAVLAAFPGAEVEPERESVQVPLPGVIRPLRMAQDATSTDFGGGRG